jgi:hypothetical protein
LAFRQVFIKNDDKVIRRKSQGQGGDKNQETAYKDNYSEEVFH